MKVSLVTKKNRLDYQQGFVQGCAGYDCPADANISYVIGWMFGAWRNAVEAVRR